MSQKPAVNQERLVRASAQVLAHHRWNNDTKGQDVFRQLLLWADDDGDEGTLAQAG
jgi:hypothetical protein